MAPCSRLEEKLRKLGLSTDDSGCSRSSPASKEKYQFRIFFPMPPYDGLQFSALRSGTGFNFTGQLLGIGGKQLQRIKQESAARLQVNNAEGNLNGSHPDPLDPNLHALIQADSLSKLQKAAMMVWELLAPVNGKFLPIDVVPGGSVRLTVKQPGKAAAATPKTAAQQKKPSKPEAAPISSANSSTSESSVDTRPVSVSPLLTPVTPAAAAGQRPSRGSIEVTPSSCCSYSETYTPDSKLSSSGSSNSSSGSNMRCMFSSLDGFSLPPAALPPAEASFVAHASPHHPQQQQVVTTAAVDSTAVQEDQLLEPATPCSGAAAAAAYSSKPTSIELSSQPQQQQQQQPAPQPGNSTSCRSLSTPMPIMQQLGSMSQQVPGDNYSSTSGGAAGVAMPAVADAPSETAFAGAAGAAAAEACLLPLGAVLQKPDWQQQQQQTDSPVFGLGLSADGSSSSCFQYGLGLSSTSLDSSSSSCIKESPALQALLVDHQRQQQQQQQQHIVEQQMRLMHIMHMQQQAHVGSFGSSQSAFGSSASLFGGPSPLLGPRTSSFGGSFECDSLQLGPTALMHMTASSAQQQLGLSGMRPAGLLGNPGLAGAAHSSHASGSLACSMGMPESSCFAGSQVYGAVLLHEQQQLLAIDREGMQAAGEGLCGSFDGLAGLSSSVGQYPPSMHAGGLLGGLHLPGSVASCWAAGPNELPGSPVLFGMTPPSAAAFGTAAAATGVGASGDSAHDPAGAAAGASGAGAGLVTQSSLSRGVMPPAWLQAEHQHQQQQHEMITMMNAGQQLPAMQHQHHKARPYGSYSGPSLVQPGSVSIW